MSSTPQIPRAKSIEMLCIMFTEQEELIAKLTKALAKLGCSCTQKTRETALEAHEVFCTYKMAMQDLTR
jgi:hypothetical protein